MVFCLDNDADSGELHVTNHERMRITKDGYLKIGGHSANRDVGGLSAQMVHLEGTSGSASISLINNQNSGGNSALYLGKSRGTSIGSNVILQNGDPMGSIVWCGSDGNDMISQGAVIVAEVDGTPGSNDMPGRLVFKTTADGAATTTERLRITSDGKLGINYAGTPPSEDVMICTAGQASPAGLTLSHTSGGNRYGARLQTISGTNQGIIISGLFNSSYTERVRITSNGQIQQLATGGDNQFVTKRTSAAGSNGDYYFHLFANNNSGTNMGALGIVRDTGNDNSRMMFYTANSGTNKERARINRWGGLQLRNIQPPYGSSSMASRYVYAFHRDGTYNTFWVEIRFAAPGSYCLDLRLGGFNNRNMHYTYQGYVYAGGDYSSAAAIDSGNGPQRYYSNQGAYNTYGTIIRFGFSSMSSTHPVVHYDLSYGAAGGDNLAEITNMLWS